MALIEQAPETMNRERMLSLLKSLRDDAHRPMSLACIMKLPIP